MDVQSAEQTLFNFLILGKSRFSPKKFITSTTERMLGLCYLKWMFHQDVAFIKFKRPRFLYFGQNVFEGCREILNHLFYDYWHLPPVFNERLMFKSLLKKLFLTFGAKTRVFLAPKGDVVRCRKCVSKYFASYTLDGEFFQYFILSELTPNVFGHRWTLVIVNIVDVALNIVRLNFAFP